MAYRSGLLFDWQKAIRLSGMSKKAYTRYYNSMFWSNKKGPKCSFHRIIM
ncbi:unnamed protein product [Prunus brigantina]